MEKMPSNVDVLYITINIPPTTTTRKKSLL